MIDDMRKRFRSCREQWHIGDKAMMFLRSAWVCGEMSQ